MLLRRLAVYKDELGAAPYNSVSLEVRDDRDSQLLAVELAEALAARWPLLIQTPTDGLLMTTDDVRARVHIGATELFSG